MSTIERALNRQKTQEVGRPPAKGQDALSASAGRVPAGDACQALGPPLHIDLSQLRRISMIPPVADTDRLSNEYRRIKRPLVNNAIGRGVAKVPDGNLIMVTSAIEGEGKTFTSLNLAMSIALDPDFSVTLVDGDTARRDLSRILGLAEAPGLLNLLADEDLDPSGLIRPTDIETLSVLPAGHHHALSEELLSSDRMARRVSQLRGIGANHIVLFDAAPVLAAPETVTLSQHVAQIAMVVKASSTRQHEVTMALESLDSSKAINMILNQSLGRPGGERYGGYYGYGAGDAE